MLKKTILSLLIFIITFVLVSCEAKEDTGKKDEVQPGDDLRLLDDVRLDYENAFFDDFSNGVDPNNWYIADQAWGGFNGGVISENVSYTDDGILLLKGNGGYYLEGEVNGVGDVKDGRYTGAALISNFVTGPGRYEIKMKVLPRLGACTAFWTYAYEFDDRLNHEIDIELPGGNRSGTPTFTNLLNTNYIKESQSYSQDVNVSNVMGNEVYLNDGEWHTFGFDWYTDPEQIIYYIDGKVCATSDLFIPSLNSRLWVGVWFPVSSAFVGSADFESDYMEVDYISYIPFKDQPQTPYNPSPNGVASLKDYPTVPVTKDTINKIANGTFEYVTQSTKHMSGWLLEKYIIEEQEVEDVCNILDGIGYENSKALFIKDNGVASQLIDAVYNNFAHDFSFKSKGKGTLIINYYSNDRMIPLQSYTIELDSIEFKDYLVNLVAPEGSMIMEIQFDTFTGEQIIIDNTNLLYLGGE